MSEKKTEYDWTNKRVNEQTGRKESKESKIFDHLCKKKKSENKIDFLCEFSFCIPLCVLQTHFFRQPYMYNASGFITTRLELNRICIHINTRVHNIVKSYPLCSLTHFEFVPVCLALFSISISLSLVQRFTHSIVSHAISFQFERVFLSLVRSFSLFISINAFWNCLILTFCTDLFIYCESGYVRVCVCLCAPYQ